MPAPRPQMPSESEGSILILGAGAMGRLWAATLPAGASIFLARPNAPLSPCQYQFQPFQGDQRAVSVTRTQASAVTSASVLLVTTKAPDTLDALRDLLPQLPVDVPIALFQNGMGSQQAVAEQWPERPILAAVTTEGANRPTSELTIHAGRGQTWIGGLTSAGQQRICECLTQLSTSGLDVMAEAEINQRLWRKLIINAGINPFTALLDCANGDILDASFFREHIDSVCEELAHLMTAEGLPETNPASLRKEIEGVARNTARNTSSMRADVLRGRSTEIDFINGYIARRGAELNLDVSTNRMLTDRIKELTR